MKGNGNSIAVRLFRWYGFDLDGTIADNSKHNSGMGDIGNPIKPMVSMMKRLYAKGYTVKIVTARLNDVGTRPREQKKVRMHIWRWCDRNLGFRPEITDRKDGFMECLYDDRARQVIRNKGVDMGGLAKGLAEVLQGLLDSPKKGRERAEKMCSRCKNLGLI